MPIDNVEERLKESDSSDGYEKYISATVLTFVAMIKTQNLKN